MLSVYWRVEIGYGYQLVGGKAGMQIVSTALALTSVVSLGKGRADSEVTYSVTWKNYLKGLEKYVYFLLLTGLVLSYSQ